MRRALLLSLCALLLGACSDIEVPDDSGDALTCAGIWACYAECDDQDGGDSCYANCHNAGTPQARAADDNIWECADPKDCADFSCVVSECPVEYGVCNPTGTDACGAALACHEACGGFEPCEQACFNRGDAGARALMGALLVCVDATECGTVTCAECQGERDACNGG